MIKSTRYILPLIALLFILLPACEGIDEHYSSNPNHRLSFSVDTLSFDTIFSTVGSTTKQFMIYNKNSEPLNIESILLAGAGTTGFRMNVDGRKGDSFNHIGIQAKDSMFVFVEVTVDPNGNNQPFLIRDSIVFTANGIRQNVLLEAYGQDVHLYKGGNTITNDALLAADKPYLIYDSLVVAPDVTVAIEEGATFHFHNKAKLVVHGTVKALGTMEQPITFRGDRSDYILYGVLPYDRNPGEWDGIYFNSESYDNEFDHVIVRNGTNGITFASSDPSRSKLKMNNSQITNMDGHLFTATNCDMEIANSEFSNASGAIVALYSGNYQFTHCTLTNFMKLKSRNDTLSYALLVSNELPDKQTGMISATFDNCIIDGTRTAVTGERFSEINLYPLSSDVYYRFNHCVMKYKHQNDDTNFIGNEFIETSLSYRMIAAYDNQYNYDFRLDSVTTVGVSLADPLITQQYPVDRYGVDRLTSPNGPTIGAYEFVPAEEKDDD